MNNLLFYTDYINQSLHFKKTKDVNIYDYLDSYNFCENTNTICKDSILCKKNSPDIVKLYVNNYASNRSYNIYNLVDKYTYKNINLTIIKIKNIIEYYYKTLSVFETRVPILSKYIKYYIICDIICCKDINRDICEYYITEIYNNVNKFEDLKMFYSI